jgi:hypothetical protein
VTNEQPFVTAAGFGGRIFRLGRATLPRFSKMFTTLHLRNEVIVVTRFRTSWPTGSLLRARAKICYILSAIRYSEGGVSHNVAAIPPAAHPS